MTYFSKIYFFSSFYGENVYYNSTPDIKGRHRKLVYLNYQLHKVSIIVAGIKYYGKILVSKDWTPTCKAEVKYFWTKAEYNEWIKTKIPEKYHDQFVSQEEDFKPTVLSVKPHISEWMLENRVVSITLDIRNGKFTRNLVLNGDNLVIYGLQRIVDSTTMFHNVDQWVSIMNDPTRKMIEISDKDKIAKHGMDKTSFRKVSS